MYKLKSFIITALLTTPVVGLAQQGGSGVTDVQPLPEPPFRDFGGFIGILNTVLDWMFTVILILSMIYILIAAYKYLTAAGDEEQVKSAHKTVVYAAIGIAVALMTQAVRFVIENLVRS
ncbi:MAG: hypothetical protein Q8O87_02800 [bacterium]|nr:hypothetical protein [bacterium]